MHQFGWLLAQGAECSLLVLMSPIGWGLLVLAGFTGMRAVRDKRWPAWTWGFLAWPLVLSCFSLAWAQTHWRDPADPESATEGPVMVLKALFFLYGVGAAATIYFNRPARAATTAVLSLGSFLFLGCLFVASMAVTGLWL